MNDCLEVADGAVRVNRKVLKGTELVTLPLSMVLTPEKGALGADTALAAALLGARDLNWVKEFPTPNAVFLWSDEELKWIDGSPVYDRVLEVRDELLAEWESNRQALNCRADEFLTAVAWVRAHGATMGNGKTVVAPFAASARTAENGNCTLQEKGGFFGKKSFALMARSEIAEGDGLTVTRDSSGADSGASLLELGVLSGRASYSLSVSVSKLDKFFEDKEVILESQELSPNEAFVLYAGESPPDEFVAYLRLMCLATSDAFLLEPIFSAQVWDFMQLPVSKTNEEAVCNFVIGACEDALDGYRVVDGEGVRADMARELVEGEKKVLTQCRNWFERRRMQLDEMQYYQERRLDELDLLRPLDESEIVDGGSGVRVGRAFDQGM